MSDQEVSSYRVQGFDCMGCALKFERNVRRLEGVSEARVNFGASKITVIGHTTIKALEKAGAFENLRVYNESEQIEEQEPFWKRKANRKVYLSAVLSAVSWIIGTQIGEQSLIPTIGYLAAILTGGYSLFIDGLRSLIRLDFDMNTLMTIAIIGAAAIGQFEEGAVVVILFAISEALESYSAVKARQSIQSLLKMAPKETLIRRDGQELMMPVENVRIGDIMIVKPGQKLAMDGRVVRGTSTINQSAITGESVPKAKTMGDEVFAGTLNEEGLLEIEVTKKVEDTTLSRIIHLVEESQAEKAPSQAFVDRFAKYYTPAVIICALLIALVPPLFTGASWGHWIYLGLAMLVVSCPCALVISTPVAIVTAIGNAARNGVIIKGGIHLEQAGSLKVIAFDKTGTLTKGVPEVTNILTIKGNEADLLTLMTALEKLSQHPLATAVVREAEARGLHFHDQVVTDFQSLTGKGAKAVINQKTYYAGSPKLFEEVLPDGIQPPVRARINTFQKQGKTVLAFGTAGSLLAVLAVADQLRNSAKPVISALHRSGIEHTVMLTGDNKETAGSIGRAAGVTDIQAELLPEDKLNVIKSFHRKRQNIAMVGDGVNDAPALAEATLGIAMGGAGTDAALETADIALMSDDLTKLPYTIRLSRKALAVIKQNISFSLVIKFSTIMLVFPGWLTLWIAILADVGATLMVTLNSLRLTRVRDK
ncbi:heavy metal translocating P-type ATPase [Sporolactobacillus sp. Y61]|uniref:Cd(2+)-exporting ATPase n=1 Tax=Sporolactobacillus sp. Y61 TaxID=3160863 RepID=A0AAU8IH18_9BACL